MYIPAADTFSECGKDSCITADRIVSKSAISHRNHYIVDRITQPDLTKTEEICHLRLVETQATVLYNNHTNHKNGGFCDDRGSTESCEKIPLI